MLTGLIHRVIERVKLMIATRAAQELAADCVAHAAERKARLLELASAYEAAGQTIVAQDLRRQASAMDDERPLAGVLPALAFWGVTDESARALPEAGQERPGAEEPRQ